eukprot:CAMPEP_0167775232 /NCGR_PEP_ID=MMETSP0111_2-20121227/2439_1 /TAXON_ID=91324 /ORGANISM="Lotharella globosa, Strain CCCM811" /LENGTH=140 /DNA_ID=CAMNT_0007665113 /DNA_START=306 /DNA_END=729 /DNA_ORIENTATION=+
MFETGSPQDQLLLHSAISQVIREALDGFEGTVLAYGAVARKEMVAKGVPVDIDEETLVNSNLGLVDPASITRLNTYFEGRKTPSTTVMFAATSDEAVSKILSLGLKEVTEGHVAKSCQDEMAKDIDFQSRTFLHSASTVG